MENPQLLILDGHNSHITIKVVAKAKEVGLHLVTLPSHISHALQPLDVGVFGPFKCAFRIYRNIWTMNNKGKGSKKVVLAEWVSKALGRALTLENIQSGFHAIWIYLLNSHAMDSEMGPSTVYEDAGADIDALSQEVQTLIVEEVMEEDTKTPVNSSHFYILQDNNDVVDTSQQHVEGGGSQGDEQSSQDLPPHSSTCGQDISSFLILPKVPASPTCEDSSQVHRMQPLVDYSRSIIMTFSTYIEQLQQVATKKEAAAQLKEAKKLEAVAKKQKNQENKLEHQTQKKQSNANTAEKK